MARANYLFFIAAGVFVVGAGSIAACSSSDNPAPGNQATDSGIPTVDTGGKDSNTATDSGVGDSTTTDTGPGTDAADTTPWDAASGTCFGGTPKSNLEFLNKCPDPSVTCQPFDNKARCPKINPDGTLPPLP